jgi:hypothetical protein
MAPSLTGKEDTDNAFDLTAFVNPKATKRQSRLSPKKIISKVKGFMLPVYGAIKSTSPIGRANSRNRFFLKVTANTQRSPHEK